MKTLWKKNQLILTALAVVIAVAGYLTYTGETGDLLDADADTENQAVQSDDLLELSDEEILAENMALENASPGQGETEAGAEGQPGDAILTSGNVADFIAEAQLSREQIRTKNQETLLEIINNESIAQEQKQAAVDQMVRMTEIAEMENATETLLAAKGFESAVVSITDSQVDVVLGQTSLSDAERAQVEDIVKRKTEMEADSIIISLMAE